MQARTHVRISTLASVELLLTLFSPSAHDVFFFIRFIYLKFLYRWIVLTDLAVVHKTS